MKHLEFLYRRELKTTSSRCPIIEWLEIGHSNTGSLKDTWVLYLATFLFASTMMYTHTTYLFQREDYLGFIVFFILQGMAIFFILGNLIRDIENEFFNDSKTESSGSEDTNNDFSNDYLMFSNGIAVMLYMSSYYMCRIFYNSF